LCKTRGAALSNDGRHPFHHQPSLACHVEAASDNRWGHRDATAILIAYRHGLRASELVALRWDDIDFQTGKLHVRRAKGGTASVHPIGGRELRALRRLKRETPASIYVFLSERLAPLGVAGYQRMVGRDCVPLSIMTNSESAILYARFTPESGPQANKRLAAKLASSGPAAAGSRVWGAARLH
jgi:Phage integrase family